MKPPLPSSSSSPSVLRKPPRQLSPYLFSLLVFIVFVAILYGEDVMCIFSQQLQLAPYSAPPGESTQLVNKLNSNKTFSFIRKKKKKKTNSEKPWFAEAGLALGRERRISKEKLPFAFGKTEESCDVFSGKWVWDESRPLYEESECPYIQPQLTCLEHGRPETKYQNWRWQPNGCDLPRYAISFIFDEIHGLDYN